jgi:cilia- and flagella-associated protein 52
MAEPPTAAVELEHVCGLSNRFFNTVQFHSQKKNLYVYPVGSCVVLEDIDDPHNQDFLRAHDAEISALAISSNGKMIASGQRGSDRRKGAISPVIIWDYEKREIYKDFGGLADSVLCLEFSGDGRFLVATGANCMIYIWDVTTGEVVYGRKTESICTVATWGPIKEPGNGSRYPR